MKRVWLESYPEGVPHDIDPDAFPSVWAMVENAIDRYRERPAFTNMGANLRFGDLDVMSGRFASWLQHEARIEKGDRVAIMLPNLLQYPVALFGALRAGAVVVNTNPLYTPRELAHQLRDSGARVIIVLENFAKVLQEAMDGGSAVETVVVSAVGDMLPAPKSWLVNFVVRYVKKAVPRYRLTHSVPFKQALARGSKPLRPVELGRDDLAFLQYTGGTTGAAKGAMLTHGNMVANVEQSKAWISSVFGDDSEGIITALPLYHIFALTANCLTFMCIGGVNHLITNPRDLPAFVRELSRLRFSALPGVNTLFNGLLNTPGFDAIDFSGLKLSLGGGMSVQRAVAERWQEVTGCPLLEAYGLTEASPAVCINPLDAGNLHRHHRTAHTVDRSVHARRGGQRRGARRGGGALRARAAGDARLLESSRRHRRVYRRGWVARYRRHRGHGRTGLREHSRSQEGHDPGFRIQRVPERGRTGGRFPPRRPRSGGNRHTR